MRPAKRNIVAFDKERAKEKFKKEHPDWDKKQKRRKFTWNRDRINQFIQLFNDIETDSAAIAEIMDISYSEYVHVVMLLRKRGLVGEKPQRPSFEENMNKLLDQLV